MDLACHKCGFRAAYFEFAYLCRNGCPACGESDIRKCPRCGARCVFSRAEALEGEEAQLKDLAFRLCAIEKTSGPAALKDARRIIALLGEMNLRWNIPELGELIVRKQRELFLPQEDV